ncbi:MAG: alpha/beta fold hydrolase [Candidatus Aenigmarchaeota archaeon]|nr:alpha/beta fold hydrolase [Candidatus Aenigmarchaeota archaeon]
MPLKINFEGHDGNLLSGVLHKSKKDDNSIVISVHGFGADKNYWIIKELSKYLDKKEIASMRFDFMGAGDSEGDVKDSTIEQMVGDLNAAVKYAKEKGYKKIAVTGHSLGGMVAIIAATLNKDVHALMLMAPAIDIRHAIKKRMDTYKHTKDGMAEVAKTKVKKSFLKNISRHVYNEARNLKIPVLIIHGDSDKSTDIENARKFFKKLQTVKRLVTVKNANHHFSKRSHLDVLLKEAHKWLVKNNNIQRRVRKHESYDRGFE